MKKKILEGIQIGLFIFMIGFVGFGGVIAAAHMFGIVVVLGID
ncbi:MAG: hypothetical protein Q8L60_10450 [Gammaproteobacteria bacterium]|nr:hypothetical protein [Gammaproteobacteria bacterium]MDP2346769.1 hypothetical protein [Gammaproteobacteria bacterium]